jgi:hypothetical protein
MLVEVCATLTTLYSDLQNAEIMSSKSKRVENLVIKSIINHFFYKLNRFYMNHN